MDDLVLGLRDPLILLLLGFLVLLWFLFRSGRKLLLVRTLTIGLLVLLIAEPMASYVKREAKKPVLSVLVDVSRSVVLPQEDVMSDSLRGLVAELSSLLEDRFSVDLRQFWSRVEPYREDVLWNHEGSGLGDVLEEVEKESDPAAILLLTDGASNTGKHPLWVAKYLDIPVFVVGVGPHLARGDLAITRVRRNSIVYAEDEVPVEVWIRAEGYSGERTAVTLKDGEKTLQSLEIEFTSETEERTVQFTVRPKTAGLRVYDVSLAPLEDELSIENNEKRFGMRVLKNRNRILYISSSPNWDHKFLRMVMEADPTMEFHSYIPLNGEVLRDPVGDVLLTRENLASYDCYIIHNVAESNLPREFSEAAPELVGDLGKSLLFMGGERSDGYGVSAIGEMLPVVLKDETVERRFEVEFTKEGTSHPVLKTIDRSDELPPLTGFRRVTAVKLGGSVWAVDPTSKTAQGAMPVIAESVYGKGRVVAITCFPVWRWYFLLKGLGKESSFYEEFMAGLARWLSTRRDVGRLVVELDQPTYQTFEEIEFSAELYDDNYRPVDGAFVKVDLEGGDELALKPVGNGRYSGKISNLAPGRYDFTVRAYEEGTEYAVKEGTVEVVEGSIEADNFGLQEDLLKKVALLTGGEYYRKEDLGGLASLDLPTSKTTVHHTIEFIYWPFIYMVLLGLLIAEWATRRLRGV